MEIAKGFEKGLVKSWGGRDQISDAAFSFYEVELQAGLNIPGSVYEQCEGVTFDLEGGVVEFEDAAGQTIHTCSFKIELI